MYAGIHEPLHSSPPLLLRLSIFVPWPLCSFSVVDVPSFDLWIFDIFFGKIATLKIVPRTRKESESLQKSEMSSGLHRSLQFRYRPLRFFHLTGSSTFTQHLTKWYLCTRPARSTWSGFRPRISSSMVTTHGDHTPISRGCEQAVSAGGGPFIGKNCCQDTSVVQADSCYHSNKTAAYEPVARSCGVRSKCHFFAVKVELSRIVPAPSDVQRRHTHRVASHILLYCIDSDEMIVGARSSSSCAHWENNGCRAVCPIDRSYLQHINITRNLRAASPIS